MRRLVLVLVSIVFVAAVAGCEPSSGWSASGANRTYTVIPAASDTTVNPLRGYYRWRGTELVPQATPAKDAYERFQWRDLEPTQGHYDFSKVTTALNNAAAEGRRFAFRVRMMIGYEDNQIYVPGYVVNNAACSRTCGFWVDTDSSPSTRTYVPDWNDLWLQGRAAALLKALANALGPTNPNIDWIDVGMLGQYGEWITSSAVYSSAPAGTNGIVQATEASKRAFADMHFNAFPAQQHVMFLLYGNKLALRYAFTEQTITQRPVGWRVDCLGEKGFFDQWLRRPSEFAEFENRWIVAPVVAEFCPFATGNPTTNPSYARAQAAQFHVSAVGNGNFGSGTNSERWASLSDSERSDMLGLGREAGYRYAITASETTVTAGGSLKLNTTLRNDGNAPAYEPWTVQAELINSNNVAVWTSPITINLLALKGAGASQAFTTTRTLPALDVGDYTLRLVIRNDSTNPRSPMQWADEQRTMGGTAVEVATLHFR